jgi:hypothetical protein
LKSTKTFSDLCSVSAGLVYLQTVLFNVITFILAHTKLLPDVISLLNAIILCVIDLPLPISLNSRSAILIQLRQLNYYHFINSQKTARTDANSLQKLAC